MLSSKREKEKALAVLRSYHPPALELPLNHSPSTLPFLHTVCGVSLCVSIRRGDHSICVRPRTLRQTEITLSKITLSNTPSKLTLSKLTLSGIILTRIILTRNHSVQPGSITPSSGLHQYKLNLPKCQDTSSANTTREHSCAG